MGKHRKRRGSSKAGRPRQAGDRYPSGKLRPPKPNARVLAEREQLLGSKSNLERAENPADLALARGWLDERQHRAGAALARIYVTARLQAPGLDTGGPKEVAPSAADVSRRGLQDWTDQETATIFDAVFNVAMEPLDTRAERAMAHWRVLSSILNSQQREAVLDMFVRSTFPSWLHARCRGDLTSCHERSRDTLIKGLNLIANALFTKVDSARSPHQAQSREARAFAPGRKQEEVVEYVSESGELLYTAVRRVRACA